jgi:modulator of FtsH protease HflK
MAWDWDKLQQKRGAPGQHPPEIDEVVQKIKKYRGKIPGLPIIIGVIIVIWLLTGIYIVSPDEVGVVKRFGKMVYTTTPGPHYHMPYPIETVMRPKVTQVRRVEIGFRTISPGPPAKYQRVPQESLMLTGDENIVDIQFIVQYKIKNAPDYLFNAYQPEAVVKYASEASMRQVIGRNKIDEALTVGKYKIQQDTKDLLQNILDLYKVGVQVVAVQLQDVHPPSQVIQAFKDVASAKEDKIKYINDAQGYANDILPKAKGRAAEIVNQATAYQQERINYAEGDASRFLQTLKEYESAKDITKRRIYLETMEDVLRHIKKVIVPKQTGEKILPFLPLAGMENAPKKGGQSK